MSKTSEKLGPIAFYGLRPGSGSADPALVSLMNHLVECGFQVHLLIDEKQPSDLSVINSDIHVINIQAGGRGKLVTSLGDYFLQHRPVALLAVRERANRLAVKARRKVRFPVRIVFRVGINTTVSKWLYRQSFHSHDHHIDSIITVSKGLAEDASRKTGIPKDQIHVIPNPKNSEAIKPHTGTSICDAWPMSYLEAMNVYF